MLLRSLTVNLFLATLFSVCPGCVRTAQQDEGEAPIPMAAPIKPLELGGESRVLQTPQTRKFGKVELTIPAGWEERPLTSTFVMGEYRFSGESGPARVTLATAGGDVAANIERWQGQFQRGADDPPLQRESITANGHEVVLVEIAGTFRDGFNGGAPQPEWGLLGAVIPLDDSNFFLKITGPQATLRELKAPFRTMIDSVQIR